MQALDLGDIDQVHRAFEPSRKRVPGTLIPRVNDLWLLTHPELRSRKRVRALMAHLADYLAPERPLFEGERPR